jgi:hypothetical protein
VQTFTFFLLDGLTSTPSFLVDQFVGQDDALEFARDLLDKTSYSGIEITRGEDRIALVQRCTKRRSSSAPTNWRNPEPSPASPPSRRR